MLRAIADIIIAAFIVAVAAVGIAGVVFKRVQRWHVDFEGRP